MPRVERRRGGSCCGGTRRKRPQAGSIPSHSPHTLQCPCDSRCRTGTPPPQHPQLLRRGSGRRHRGTGTVQAPRAASPAKLPSSQHAATSAHRQGTARHPDRAGSCRPRPMRTAWRAGKTRCYTRPSRETGSLHKLRPRTTRLRRCRARERHWRRAMLAQRRSRAALRCQLGLRTQMRRPSQMGTQGGMRATGAGTRCHQLHAAAAQWRG